MLGVGTEGPLAPAIGAPDPRSEERQAWAVLASVDGLGPVGFARLLATFGSGRRILAVATESRGPERIVEAAGTPTPGGSSRSEFSLDVAQAMADAAMRSAAIAARIAELGLIVVTVDDPAYPRRLASIEFPPHLLFVRGDPASLETRHLMAVVGTRRATDVGRSVAARLCRALASAGATVVSGLAVGIDGAAHAATLDSGGTTVAVLGGGHARLYPRAHRRLADEIADTGGAVVSERAPDVEPTRWSFPRRNRVISGLTDATIVVEAPARSGALVTASWALEQGRGCYLVPGAIDDPAVAGNLAFLREFPDVARVVSGIPQLLEDLGLAERPDGKRATTLAGATITELGGAAAQVARAMVAGHATVDELVAVTSLPVASVLATLTVLERRGLALGVYGRYRPAGSLALHDPGIRPQRPRLPAA